MKNLVYEPTLEILKCHACGTLTIGFVDSDGNGERIGSHKCAGRWEVVQKVPVRFDQFTLNSYCREAK